MEEFVSKLTSDSFGLSHKTEFEAVAAEIVVFVRSSPAHEELMIHLYQLKLDVRRAICDPATSKCDHSRLASRHVAINTAIRMAQDVVS